MLYSSFGIAFLGILVLLLAWGVLGFALKRQETVANKRIAKDKVLQLEKRKEKLEEDIKYLNTDKGKEQVFRKDYGMGLPGEGLIIVVDDKKIEPKNPEKASRSVRFPRINSFFKGLLD